MRISQSNDMGFEPITITLDTVEEARALKVLCTTTAKDAVLTKDRLNLTSDELDAFADNVFRALKDYGVTYLTSR